MKKIRKNTIIAALTALGLGTALASPALADESFRTLDEIKESGTVNIGVFSDKSPFGYVDENGEYQGYDVYLAERLGEDLGVEINYVSTEAANRIEYLQTGKVDIILANFTVTPERAEEVDFALPYMNVALGVVSPEDAVIESLDDIGEDDQVIVISGTTAETYLVKNYPEIKLQKYDAYAEAKTAFENGNGVAWANDNTEVIAFSIENEGYVVGIPSLGSADTIAPAVTKGNETLLNWLNEEIVALGEENFFHADYEATLLDTYGADYEDTLVIEGGAVAGSETEAEETEAE
ncbi:MAG: transporter substrate-binding domain-containing protein [Lachnospiraceae bacterium]|nr:transporter substrate-binding domain-containing protein [Lachnospiraceae bacterium]